MNRICLTVSALGLLASLGAAQDYVFIQANTQSLPAYSGDPLDPHIVAQNTISTDSRKLEQQYIQTGLESLTVYGQNGVTGVQTPWATYNNVRFTFTPMSMSWSGTTPPGTGVKQYTGGPGTITVSSDGHPNLLTVDYTQSSYFSQNIHHFDQATSTDGVVSGELADRLGFAGLSGNATIGRLASYPTGRVTEDFSFQAKVTPEPFTAIALGVSGLSLAARARRRRHAASKPQKVQ